MNGKKVVVERRYSTMQTIVKSDQYILEIYGKRSPKATGLILLLSTVFYYMINFDSSILMQLSLGLSSFFLSYALFEVLFTKCFFHLNLQTRHLCVMRGNPFGYADYEGMARPGMLQVVKKSVGRFGRELVKRYQIILIVRFHNIRVDFLLDPDIHSNAIAQEKVTEWSNKLGLDAKLLLKVQ